MIRQLVEAHDADVTVKVLLPSFRSYLNRHFFESKVPLTEDLKRQVLAAVELLVLAFDNTRDLPQEAEALITTTGFNRLNLARPREAVRKALLAEKRARSDRIMELAREDYWKRRDKFASPTRHHEDDPNLPAPVKARVFMNALRERNDAGAFQKLTRKDEDGVVIEVEVKFSPLLVFRLTDRDVVEELFDHFVGSSVSDILLILDACVSLRADRPTALEDEPDLFYPAKGYVLSWLLQYPEQIVDQLDRRFCTNYRRRLKV